MSKTRVQMWSIKSGLEYYKTATHNEKTSKIQRTDGLRKRMVVLGVFRHEHLVVMDDSVIYVSQFLPRSQFYPPSSITCRLLFIYHLTFMFCLLFLVFSIHQSFFLLSWVFFNQLKQTSFQSKVQQGEVWCMVSHGRILFTALCFLACGSTVKVLVL